MTQALNEWEFASPPFSVTNFFEPDDKPDVVYISCDFMGGSVSIASPRRYSKELFEGDVIQIKGVFIYKEKNGKKKIKFAGHEVIKPAGSKRRTASDAT